MSLKVDLKSKEVRRGVSFDYGWIFVLIALLVAFVIFYAYGLKLKSEVDAKNQELATWKDKVAGFSGIEGKLQALQGDISGIEAQITKLRELRYDPLRYSILLVRISKLIPSNIWLANLSINPPNNSLSFSGSAVATAGHPPLATIADLIMNLQDDKDNYFSNVVLQNTSSSGKTGDIWTFSLQSDYNVPLITQSTSSASTPAPAAAPAASGNSTPPSSGAKQGAPTEAQPPPTNVIQKAKGGTP